MHRVAPRALFVHAARNAVGLMPQLASLGAGRGSRAVSRRAPALRGLPKGVLARAPAGSFVDDARSCAGARAARAREDDASPLKIAAVLSVSGHSSCGGRDPHWVALSPLGTLTQYRVPFARQSPESMMPHTP
jgi:hypothetical protein